LGQKSAARHLLGIAVDLLGSEGCLRHLRRVSRASSPTPCQRPAASAGETGAAARSAKVTRHEKKGRSNLKCHGSLGLIKDLTWKAGVRGVWTAGPNGTWCFKLRNGAGLNWSSTKGTVWFDGPAEPQNKLHSVMEAAINRQVYPEGAAASRNAERSARPNRRPTRAGRP
jgi:hypothetical protein